MSPTRAPAPRPGRIQQQGQVHLSRGALAEKNAGIAGGYDFIVAENRSTRIDSQTVIGVTNVSPNGVRVNLTRTGDAVTDRYMQSGESLDYRSVDGRNCKVSLLSVRDGDVGAASFAIGCAS